MANKSIFALRLGQRLEQSWLRKSWLSYVLWPLSLLYRMIMIGRRWAFSVGLLTSYKAPVPVIVVGNLTVGGAGKTPLVISLVESLQALGLRPGVISRGYGADLSAKPVLVNETSDAKQVGDEPLLIFRRTKAPVVVGPDRKADIEKLLDHQTVDLIVSDDGLQHLALQRDFEICVDDRTVDSNNRYLLPAGPFREPVSRMRSVDCVVAHVRHQADEASEAASLAGKSSIPLLIEMSLIPEAPLPLLTENSKSFDASKSVHAVAGIGKPQRFFDTCRGLNWKIIEHVFPDHHQFTSEDLNFSDSRAVIMTEKDMVKCMAFAQAHHWYLPVNAKLQFDLAPLIVQRLKLSF